jgi:hypothetical protein
MAILMSVSIGLDLNQLSEEIDDIGSEHILGNEGLGRKSYISLDDEYLFHNPSKSANVEEILKRYQEKENASALRLAQTDKDPN